MTFEQCNDIKGLVLIRPNVFEDSRGLFFESFNQSAFDANGIAVKFVQDNQSISTANVIRGLHFQRNPFAQGKLVRVLQGAILDVAVDIRNGSPTYGKVFQVELSEENKLQLWLPAGFAHGFSVLSDSAVVLYKCDQFYNKEHEAGIRFDDPDLNIDWKTDLSKAVISDKDKQLPSFRDCKSNFQYE